MNRILLTTFLIFSSILNAKTRGKQIKCGTNAVASKDVCECKSGFIGDPLDKCISFLEACELNPCGSHSICVSNMSDPKVLKLGPYCICENDTHGVPPKCRKWCTFNYECQLNEYCKEDYCEDVCNDDRCGPNSQCEGKNQEAHCTCLSGFVSEPGKGCQKILSNETAPQLNYNSTLICSKYCAENANCEKKDEKIFCSCDSSKFDVSNPFIKCTNYEIVDRFSIPSIGCDCCSENLKPGCEAPIHPNVIKTLAG